MPVPMTEAAAHMLSRLAALAEPLLPLRPLSFAAYARGHAAFEARSNQRRLLASALDARLAAAAPRSVLSVGCGDGALDVVLARRLSARSGPDPVRYAGADPNPQSAARFLTRLGGLSGLQASCSVARAETLIEQSRYDTVLAVHCLYYAADPVAMLQRLRALVQPGGTLIVALAPLAELNALAGSLAPPTGGHRQWWADDLRRTASSFMPATTRETLQARLTLEDEPPHEVLEFVVQAGLPETLLPGVREYLRLLGEDGGVPHPVELCTWQL